MKTADEEKSDYNHVIKYTGLFGGVQGITLMASIIRNKLVAVLLGPAGVGLISLYNTVITLLNNATNLGISFSAVRNVSEISQEKDPEALSRYVNVVRSWSLLTAFIGMFACVVLSSSLSYWTFGNYEYTWAFILLAPVVGLMALSGGELAVLKGIRRLRQVAAISVLGALSTLFLSIPLYYFLGIKGIIPSLLSVALVTTGLTFRYSFRSFPFRIPQHFRKDLTSGISMIKLGVAFIMAGVLGSGVEYIVRTFILKTSTMDMVGLYNAGYAVTVTYAGMIFVAMDTDYFPRLSAVNKNRVQLNKLVNQQIEIAVLLIAPLMVTFLIFLPFILPLLYSAKFLPVIGMAECATLGMFFKAVTLPMAYISLAKGDSFVYFVLELIYDVCFVALILFCFEEFGLSGAGTAVTLAMLCDLLIVYGCARFRYHFHLSASVFKIFGIQIIWGIVAFILTFMERNWVYWISGLVCLGISTGISVYLLNKKTTLLTVLRNKIKR